MTVCKIANCYRHCPFSYWHFLYVLRSPKLPSMPWKCQQQCNSIVGSNGGVTWIYLSRLVKRKPEVHGRGALKCSPLLAGVTRYQHCTWLLNLLIKTSQWPAADYTDPKIVGNLFVLRNKPHYFHWVAQKNVYLTTVRLLSFSKF